MRSVRPVICLIPCEPRDAYRVQDSDQLPFRIRDVSVELKFLATTFICPFPCDPEEQSAH